MSAVAMATRLFLHAAVAVLIPPQDFGELPGGERGGGGRQGNARAAEPPSPGRPPPVRPALPMAEAGGHGAPRP